MKPLKVRWINALKDWRWWGLVISLIVLNYFIYGCGPGSCQPVGYYENCVAQGHALCVDIYPKCPEEKK